METKIEHQHINKHKSVRSNLLKLTSNTAKILTFKARQNPFHIVLVTKTA